MYINYKVNALKDTTVYTYDNKTSLVEIFEKKYSIRKNRETSPVFSKDITGL